MTPDRLRFYISQLSVDAPITEKFVVQLVEIGMRDTREQWYEDQKEHWLGWLESYHTEGYYGRDTSKKRDAKFVFNHINCPPMLLWLCESVGIGTDLIQEARDRALSTKRTFPSQCAAIRKIITWDMVENKLSKIKAQTKLSLAK